MKVLSFTIAATLSLPALSYSQTSQDLYYPEQLPPRMPTAIGGQEFVEQIQNLPEDQREHAILRAVMDGNIPEFLRNLVPVTVPSPDLDSNIASLSFWVMPDYLAVGTDHDYVRMPMNLHSAEKIGDAFDLRLPTRKMVDLIYQNAEIKLPPRPMRPGPQMTSTHYFHRHHEIIEQDLTQLSGNDGQLIAGHKKDVVQSRLLLNRPDAIAIYGWHQPTGRPIQPLSTVHHAAYADYSHGIRMVANYIEIRYKDGQVEVMSLDELLASRSLCHILSDEGVLDRQQLILEAQRHRQGRNSST